MIGKRQPFCLYVESFLSIPRSHAEIGCDCLRCIRQRYFRVHRQLNGLAGFNLRKCGAVSFSFTTRQHIKKDRPDRFIRRIKNLHRKQIGNCRVGDFSGKPRGDRPAHKDTVVDGDEFFKTRVEPPVSSHLIHLGEKQVPAFLQDNGRLVGIRPAASRIGIEKDQLAVQPDFQTVVAAGL